MNKLFPRNSRIKSALSLLLPIFFLAIRPMDMTLNQSAVLGGLFLVVLWWGTGWVHKDFASSFLIVIFLFFGNTPAAQVFYFPLSENIVMIVAAYLLSQGIVNSNVADQFSRFALDKYCTTSVRMIVTTFGLCILLIFLIPQPFPRVVLMAAIYRSFLGSKEINADRQSVFMFAIFVAATVTSLLFLNGDVIANYAALGFGGVEMTFFNWIKYMTFPTFVMTILIMMAFIFTFRKSLNQDFTASTIVDTWNIGKSGKKALAVMAVVVLFWLTEQYHGMSAAKVAAIGVVLMFLLGVIGKKDWRVINLSLLLFLTAEFGIGRVLVNSGVADAMKNTLISVLPSDNSIWFLPVIVLSVMGLHMIMGSIITALSFSIPMLIIVAGHLYPPEFIVLLVIVSVAFHYIMPFHHVTVMIGFGSEYFENKHVLKMGVALTVLTFVGVFAVYIPWWKLVGLI